MRNVNLNPTGFQNLSGLKDKKMQISFFKIKKDASQDEDIKYFNIHSFLTIKMLNFPCFSFNTKNNFNLISYSS